MFIDVDRVWRGKYLHLSSPCMRIWCQEQWSLSLGLRKGLLYTIATSTVSTNHPSRNHLNPHQSWRTSTCKITWSILKPVQIVSKQDAASIIASVATYSAAMEMGDVKRFMSEKWHILIIFHEVSRAQHVVGQKLGRTCSRHRIWMDTMKYEAHRTWTLDQRTSKT